MSLQAVVIVPESQWFAVLARIDKLEARDAAAAAAADEDPILTSAQAAAFLGLKDGRSVSKARRAGRLTGMLINERDRGYRTSELNRYLTRYNRKKLSTTP